MHPEPAHRPLALAAPTHVVIVAALPSALHTLSIVALTHAAEPGTQTVVTWQAVPVQDRPAGQGVSVYPRPSALQTALAVDERHEGVPARQIHGAHTPARQVVRAPHDTVEYAVPSALQTRSEVAPAQSVAPGVQARAVHTPPEHVVPAAQGVAV